ncbi:MAG: hypothetical protein Kow0062_13320 [Acidobacteriota bacterium]
MNERAVGHPVRTSVAFGVLVPALLGLMLAGGPALAQDASPGLVPVSEFSTVDLPYGYKAVRHAIIDFDIDIRRPDLPIGVKPVPPQDQGGVVAQPGNSVQPTAVAKASGPSPATTGTSFAALRSPDRGAVVVITRPNPAALRQQLVRILETLEPRETASR